MSYDDTSADHIMSGEAKDQETIIRQRDYIEEIVRETVGNFTSSKLYWNMTPRGTFEFEIHFWLE